MNDRGLLSLRAISAREYPSLSRSAMNSARSTATCFRGGGFLRPGRTDPPGRPGRPAPFRVPRAWPRRARRSPVHDVASRCLRMPAQRHGLQHPVRLNRLRQFRDGPFIDRTPRLRWIEVDQRQRHLHGHAIGDRCVGPVQQIARPELRSPTSFDLSFVKGYESRETTPRATGPARSSMLVAASRASL